MPYPAEIEQASAHDAALEAMLRDAARARLECVPDGLARRVTHALGVRAPAARRPWIGRVALLAASLAIAAGVAWIALRPERPAVPASQALSRAISVLPTSGSDIRRVALAPIQGSQRLWVDLRTQFGVGGTN